MSTVTKLTLILGLTAVLVAVVFVGIFAFFRGHSLTQQALRSASESVQVTDVTGTGLQAGWVVLGRIKNGKGRLSIPVTGTKGAGKLVVAGYAENDQWIVTALTFTGDGSSTSVELRADTGTPSGG